MQLRFLYIFLLGIIVSCSYTEKIRDGRTAFERKRYFQASEMLQEEFNLARSNIDRMNIAFLIGNPTSNLATLKKRPSGSKQRTRVAMDLVLLLPMPAVLSNLSNTKRLPIPT